MTRHTLSAGEAVKFLIASMNLETIYADTPITIDLGMKSKTLTTSQADSIAETVKPILPLDVTKDGSSWARHGIVLPHGTCLRINLKTGEKDEMISYYGKIVDGIWEIALGDKIVKYKTPSPAASAVIAWCFDRPLHSINGWDHWEAMLPTEKLYKNIGKMRIITARRINQS